MAYPDVTHRVKNIALAAGALAVGAGVLYAVRQPNDFFPKLESISTAAGTLVAGVGLMLTGFGLVYTARQLRLSRHVAEAESYLRIDELLHHYRDVYLKLFPEGKWGHGRNGPVSAEDLCDVVMYMGLFERVKVLVDRKMIDLDVIKRLYGYRIKHIVNNPVIFKRKCVEQVNGWRDFVELCRTLDIAPAHSRGA